MPVVPPLPPAAASDTERLMHAPATSCLNCGAVLPGAFCPDCGQKAQPLRLPLHRVVGESFSEVFGVDGRFWRSMASLLFRPGRLTQAHLDGQRTRYLRPFRLYLTATLAFFFLLSVFDPAGRVAGQIDDGRQDSLVIAASALADVDAYLDTTSEGESPRAARMAAEIERDVRQDVGRISPESREALDAAMDSVREDLGTPTAGMDSSDLADALRERQRLRVQRVILAAMPPDSLIRPVLVEEASAVVYPDSAALMSGVPSWMGSSRTIRQFNTARTRSEQIAATTGFVRAMISKIPTVMFLLLPLFALLMKALYVRRGWYYADHLVFAFHTHAFAFFAFTIVLGLYVAADGAGWGNTASAVVTFGGVPLYFLLAQKRVYGQGWGKTILKAVVLGTVYNVVLVFGLVGAALLAAAA